MTQKSLEIEHTQKTDYALEFLSKGMTHDCVASLMSERFEEDFTEEDIEKLLEGRK